MTFVKERLMMPKEDGNHKKLRDPLPKNKAPTFSSLCEVKKKEKNKLVMVELLSSGTERPGSHQAQGDRHQ